MTMQIAVLGIDLGKNSCSVVGLDRTGKVVLRRRLHRESVIKLASGLAPCVVALEACCGAHHLGRILRDQGHDIRLMSAEYVVFWRWCTCAATKRGFRTGWRSPVFPQAARRTMAFTRSPTLCSACIWPADRWTPNSCSTPSISCTFTM